MEINVDGRDPRSSDRAGRRRTVDGSTRPDSELLDWVREEDSERREAAVAELSRRHRGAASAVAARLVPAGADVDDVVEDAFERVNRAIRNGRGPTEDFRSYLVVAVRSGASDLRRGAQRTLPSEEIEAVDPDDPATTLLADLERSSVGAAFAALPERWRTVLWLVDVEQRPASEVAVILGLRPNAVAALTYRAREGLRQSYLVASATDTDPPECRAVRRDIGAYVRGRASGRSRSRVDRHVEHCDRCAALVADAREMNSTIMLSIAGLLVPAAAVAALRDAPSWLPAAGVGVGVTGWVGASAARRAVHVLRSPAGVGVGIGAAAAAIAAAVALTAPPRQVPVAAPRSVPSTVEPHRSSPVPSSVAPAPVPSESTTTAAPSTTAPVPTPDPGGPPIGPAPRPTVAAASEAAIGPSSVARVGPVDARGRVPIAVRLDRRVLDGESVVLRWRLDSGPRGELGVPPGAGSVSVDVGPVAPGVDAVTVEVAAGGRSAVRRSSWTSGRELLGTRWSGIGPFELVATGNTVLSCPAALDGCAEAEGGRGDRLSNDLWNMVMFRTDGDGRGSSTASLDVPAGARIRSAWLIWGGAAPAAATASQLSATVLSAGGTSMPVRATELLTGPDGAYQASADVTGLVVGGPVTVGGVTARTGPGSWGGWSLVVVLERAGLPDRIATIATGLSAEDVDLPLVEGLAAVDQLLAVQWDGDTGFGPDSVAVVSEAGGPRVMSDAANPEGDVANSTVSAGGVRPSGVAANTFGIDADLFELGPATWMNRPRVVVTHGPERRFVGALAWVADLG